MRRMVSISLLRSVKATTTMRPRLVRPRSRKRSSPTESVGSGTVTDRANVHSPNAGVQPRRRTVGAMDADGELAAFVSGD
jgi:hypothetical protein